MHMPVHIEEDARPVLEDAAFLIRQMRDDIHQGKSQVAFATTIGTVYPHLCNYAITHTLFAEFVVSYLGIGGFSHCWPPLDVMGHEQPEVLDFGNCERLPSFCHHFSDSLKQLIAINLVVLPGEGEE